MFETIAAIATPIGEGGIGIIRISGLDSLEILKKIFKPKSIKSIEDIKSHHLYLGFIIDKKNDDNIIDEVLISYMKSPKSYTGEDIVEINCHGGLLPLKMILELIIKNGAKFADKGEFTKRAFLNGRFDLAQAEGIIDVIRSKSSQGLNCAVKQMEGKLSNTINRLRKELLKIIAYCEASIDFPEDEISIITNEEIEKVLATILVDLKKMQATYQIGKVYRDGLKTVILGKPNVGKSSLLNTLLQEKRAIVTNIPGTTRDIIEEYINLDGIALKIIDTAGIRETEDLVEKIGVEKSIELLKDADLVLIMIDATQGMTLEDKKIINLVEENNKKYLIVLNKIDLVDINKFENTFSNIIKISAKEEIGIDILAEKIKKLFYVGEIKINQDNFITKYRHYEALIKTEKNIIEVLNGLKKDLPVDFLSIDLRGAWEYLGEITGETLKEDLLDQIFSDFCIGK